MPHAASMQQTVDRILAGIDSGFIPSSVQFIPQPIFLFSTILYSYPGVLRRGMHTCANILMLGVLTIRGYKSHKPALAAAHALKLG